MSPPYPAPPRPETAPKGRGSATNPSGRFEPWTREGFDDGWGSADEPLPPLRTTVTPDASRTIIARNQSPDIPFDQSINPYRGCEHGCVYCYARPSHGYLGLSSGLDFETRLFAKPDAARLLDAELRREGYRVQPIALGTNTDPYQPIERERRITRAILETLVAFRHPFTIVTKSALVVRDLDLLAPMAAAGMVRVHLSVTTLDRGLARRLEPRAATPSRRLDAIRALAQAGVPTGVMVAPVILGLNDPEVEAILEAAAAAGAASAGYLLLRLPHEIKDLFQEWLDAHAPLRKERVLSLIRDSRGGRLNDPNFGSRHTGQGKHAELVAERFKLAARRLSLDRNGWKLDTSQFRPPPRPGDQLSLL